MKKSTKLAIDADLEQIRKLEEGIVEFEAKKWKIEEKKPEKKASMGNRNMNSWDRFYELKRQGMVKSYREFIRLNL